MKIINKSGNLIVPRQLYVARDFMFFVFTKIKQQQNDNKARPLVRHTATSMCKL